MGNDLLLPWHPFVWDVNSDGTFTVTDVGLWLEHAFFLPGDWIIWMTLRYAPAVGQFFEVDTDQYGSTISALLSVFSWLAVAVALMTTSHLLAAADRALTRSLHNIWTRTITRMHIARRLLGGFARRKRKQLAAMMARPDRPKLSVEELRVLKAHAYVDSRSALALSDLVRATGVPRTQIVFILDRLRELELLDKRVNPDSNELAYALTDPGRDLLSADLG